MVITEQRSQLNLLFHKISILFIFLTFISFKVNAVEFTFCTTFDSPTYDYSEKLLSFLLKKTNEKHSMSRLRLPDINHQRMAKQFASGKSPCSVIILSSENLRGDMGLTMVPIPLSKGLLGARVLIYHPDIKERWLAISNVEQLKNSFTLGSVSHWNSSQIFMDAGFNVIYGNSLVGLWRMFNGKRFDLMHRSIMEAEGERLQNIETKNEFHIDTKFLFTYKADIFFYVKPEDQLRKNILTSQLHLLHDSGELQSFIHKTFFEMFQLDKSDFIQRKKIILKESVHSKQPLNIDHIPEKYWQDDYLN